MRAGILNMIQWSKQGRKKRPCAVISTKAQSKAWRLDGPSERKDGRTELMKDGDGTGETHTEDEERTRK
jgi:hypothetical protein